MTLSSTQFGSFRLFTIETGTFRLDGGAMFGVVPKTLWSRHLSCDNKNRILMAARCLLIHSQETGRVYLVDTGIGHKFDNKFSAIYGLDFSEHTLKNSLTFHGFKSTDVTDVVFTHMHFDHCGGAVLPEPAVYDRPSALTFPEARHWVHKAQWENVLKPNIREKPSFLEENIDPLSKPGLMQLIGDDHSYEPGFEIRVVNGHTPGQQLPLLKDGRRSLLYAADLLPTATHLPIPWIMGFDIHPLITIDEKQKILTECLRNETLLYLEHDPYNEVILPGNTPHKAVVEWSGRLDDM